ncbi:heme lyase CcmF/NrfE family subunit [Geminicoccus roseus]|uniref:heme lyase CcmF/NrfE family subunit n=1 Tax=Geminicoccus roseus TaxID=404900 RepID=UPI00041B24AC|nr:heme lyase CcmF/NrfE family subunit [Geminicoccus roseus]
MIPELGHLALVLALVLACVQGTLPLLAAHRGDAVGMRLAVSSAIGQFVMVSLAFGALTWAYVVSDFSVVNVAANSHSTKPLIYKISGVWGNHEGSLLLWVWILAIFGAMVAGLGGNLPLPFKARVLAVQGMIGAGFLAFVLFTSNPFLRLDPAPLDGNGLNPILQDPGLAMHPPMLYLGYVGLSTAFSFAMAALIEGRVDAAWARWLRPWVLAAWAALTFGIALGSWWAYYTLGWGGWWFWDPVENASFMPWLAATALLHSAIVVEKRDTLKAWTILLAILSFALSLLGTFLVRSGVLTSVHAFASDPTRGIFILALLLAAIGGAFSMFAWRAPVLRASGSFAPISRESGLLLNNVLLATGTGTVLLGTLYPLILDTVGGPKISVGPPYFDATFVPLMVPLLLAAPVGTLLAWKRGDLPGVLQRLGVAFLAVLVAVGVWLLAQGMQHLAAGLGLGLAVWLVMGSLVDLAERIALFRAPLAQSWRRLRGLPRSALGVVVAHAGVGLLVLGITGATALREERIAALAMGETVGLAGAEVRLVEVHEEPGPNYVATIGTFRTEKAGRVLHDIRSEKRFYPVEGSPTTKPGIVTSALGDYYYVLGDQAGDGRWTVRLYHEPLVVWIWWGAGVIGLGGLISLSDRRLRVGAPAPARRRNMISKGATA